MSNLSNIQQDTLEGFRLSPQQQRVWLAQRADGERAYCARCEFAIEGELDAGRLERALQRVVERHEILRTAFRTIPGMTVALQVVWDHPANFEYIDLRDQSEDAEVSNKERVFEAHASGFDFDQGKLLRASLLALGPQRHALLISLPALCADSATLANLFDALVFEFDANGADNGDAGEEPVQYAQFSEWRNELLETDNDASRSGLAYWAAQNPASRPTTLPFERASRAPFTSETCAVELRGDAAAKIEAFAIEHQISAKTLLFVCWQTLLWRLTGEDEVIVQRVFDGRQYDEFKRAFGLFAQSLPVSFSFASDPTFGEIARGLAATLEAMAEHQEYFAPERYARPDFRQSLAFEFFELPCRRSVGGVTWSMLTQHVCAEPFKLKLNCMRWENDVRAAIDFDPEIFDREDIERIARCFATLLDSALANPGVAASRLEILDPADLRHVVTELNQTTVHFRSEKCIHDLFEERAVRAPNSIALVCGDRQLTYAELNARSNQLANFLLSRGVLPGATVGVCLERTSEMVIAIMAILKAGGAYVALDPSYPSQRLAHMVEDSQSTLVLTQPKLRGNLPSVSDERLLLLEDVWSAIAGDLTQSVPINADPTCLAYIIYTSGSTGKPKGVMVTHANLSHYAHALVPALDLRADDRYLHTASFSFSSSVRQLMLPLGSGATVVLATRDQIGDPRVLFELVRRTDVTVMDLVPSYWRVCIQALEDLTPQARSALLQNKLRLIASASEPLSSDLPNRWRNLQSDVRVINMFGQTETTGIVATYPIGIEPQALKIVPIGRPITNTQIYILDDNQKPVALGVAGELYIGGAGVARGYLGEPDLTANRFIRDPFSSKPDARLYKTGDYARYREDVTIEFLGRQDHQVKIRGFRIELGGIEAILEKHPAVNECIVIGGVAEPGGASLIAYIVSPAGARPSAKALRSFLEERLPDYMVPAAFIMLDALPRTPNGKIDRQALRAPVQDLRRESTQEAPRTGTEKALAAMWTQILKINNVGRDEDFFDLGGQSLLAVQLISRMRETFRVQIGWRSLFESPTLSGLAERIDRILAGDAASGSDNSTLRIDNLPSANLAPITPVVRRDDLLPSFGQERLWFLEQLFPGTAGYNLQRGMRLRGVLDVKALELSLNEIVRRQEILRATFRAVGGEPRIVIKPTLTLTLSPTDTRFSDGTPITDAALGQLILEEGERVFDLTEGPLFRAKLWRLDDQDHVLALTMHHIVSDGWSMGVIYRELSALYEAFSVGRASPLSELPVQYVDFAHWQRQSLQGKVLEERLYYWKRQLGDLSVLDLPTDRPRPSVQTYSGAQHRLRLAEPLVEALKTLSRKQGCTLYMLLLAAFQAVLHRYNNQDDICVGSALAGRGCTEIERLVGFFVNTPVLRAKFSSGLTFRELLNQVRETVFGAQEHQDIPYEKLVGELHLERDLSRPPLFQVMFNFLNFRDDYLKLAGLTVEHLPPRHHATKFDLSLVMEVSEKELAGTLWYNTVLFDAATIERFGEHYRMLLERVVANPDQKLAALPLLSEVERDALIHQLNRTQVDFPKDKTIVQLFEAQSALSSGRIALVCGDQTLTYAELNEQANRLAHHLIELGAGPDVPIGLCIERSIGMIVSLLAILKAGAAYVPLDPSYLAKRRLALMLEDAKPAILITQTIFKEKFAGHGAKLILIDEPHPWMHHPATNPGPRAAADNLAYVIYTSGSTGTPKGVMVEHRSLVNYSEYATVEYGLRADDRVLQFASLNFDASAEEIYPCLTRGATLVLRGDDMLASAAQFLESCREWKLTVLSLPTAYWHEIAASVASEKLAVPASLRCVIIGGEAAATSSLANWQKWTGNRVELINTYGPTEATVVTTRWKAPRAVRDLAAVPIGRPIANTEVYILDPHFNPVPIGVPGELHIGGAGLARGYLNRPELTKEKFVVNPFSDDRKARLYKSGDLARYRPDGNIEFLGRIDDQVKIWGFRIELGEIEACLRQHPKLREAAVLVREDHAGEKRLTAYFVPNEASAPASADELRSFLKDLLPDYMLPSAFVALDQMPLTPNGKLNRKALPAPDQSRSELADSFVPPRTPNEQTLAAIWAEVLKLEKIGIHDNFFDLGGHSLLATQVISRVKKTFEANIQLRALFESPTVAGLSALIVQKQAETLSDAEGREEIEL